MTKAIVTIKLKRGVLDAEGKAIESVLDGYGIDNVTSVRVDKQVEINFSDNQNTEAKVEKLCQELLVNHVMEEYSYTIEESGNE